MLRLFICLLAIVTATAATAQTPQPVHAMALHGAPKYAPDFTHFDYTDPNAPKSGQLTLASVGTFDSLNPFIVRGVAAAGLGMIYQTLLEKSLDEPLTSYGLLACDMTVPNDRSWVQFTLRDEAVWDDGKKITPDDVIWTFNTLLKSGQPFYRSYYNQVATVTAVGKNAVRFTFKKAGNAELPLIVGDMPVLPKHYWTAKGNDFTKTTLTPPVGSGPYRIAAIDAGRRIDYVRVKNWWGEKLPINVGRYNFDRIVFDYYRDPQVAFQAFMSGAVDFRQENIARNWATGYKHPNVTNGKIVLQEIKHQLPAGMQGFFYNTRRAPFNNVQVREALAYAFDFEWANKQFAFGGYSRANSYFSNAPLAATMPISEDEKKLLEPYRAQIAARVFTDVYNPPRTDGTGNIRDNLRIARDLLAQAGWTLHDGVLKNATGDTFHFEILDDTGGMFDRWVLPFIANLKKLGITATLRPIDVAQYQNRVNDFDFDMIMGTIPQSLTPGNEQTAFFGSAAAAQKGSQNYMGVNDMVVDALIDKLVHADSMTQMTTIARAMDRVLQWQFYVIPQWYVGTFRIAYAARLGHPPTNPPYGLPVMDTWWQKK